MTPSPTSVHLIFRKRYPTAFSIERLFDQLTEAYRARGVEVSRLELPYYNNTIKDFFRNLRWAATQVQGHSPAGAVKHVTGDVNSVLMVLSSPSVFTVHDCNMLIRYPTYHPRYWFYRLLIFELPARRAKAVTVISEKTKQELLRLTGCPAHKIEVIPNFVDPAITYRPKPFPDRRPTLLQIGVKPNKNLGRVAAALEGIDCRLEIIGQPAPEDQRALERHGIDYGWRAGLSDEEVRQAYQDCDALLFVTTYEGFGLPILEAQKTGRVVITSDLSPHREVAGKDGASLVDPHSIESIRQGVLEVLNDPALRQRLIQGGITNVDRYSIGAVADAYLDLYRRVRQASL